MTATISSPGDSSPSKATAEKEIPHRAATKFTPKWQRFQTTLLVPQQQPTAVSDQAKQVHAYQRQYSHVYHYRLAALKDRCWQALRAAGSSTEGATKEVSRILELREQVPSMVVGTLVKETTNVKDDLLLSEEASLTHRCRASDQLYLEDESGRVQLALTAKSGASMHEFCTGVVVGVMGTVDGHGVLQVDLILPPAPLASDSPPLSDAPSEDDPHLLVVAGLQCGDPTVSPVPRDMLLSYLQGHFTLEARKVCRALVVGPSCSKSAALDGMKELNAWVGQVGQSGIPVEVLPAASDPTTRNWPQRPLHSSLLSRTSPMVTATPNPYLAEHTVVGDADDQKRLVLASDGANVTDLRQSVSSTEPSRWITAVEALEKLVHWGHWCPTGPDTLPTVPHLHGDPMVMDLALTNALVLAGGATHKVETKWMEDVKTRLVALPSFAETGQVALVNMKTLGVHVLKFEERE